MLVLRWIGEKIVARDPDRMTWHGVIGRVLARTSILFMIAAAIDIVINYADAPRRDRARRRHHLHHRRRAPGGGLGARTDHRRDRPPRRRASRRNHARQCDGDHPRAGQRRSVRDRDHRHPRQSRGQRHRLGRRPRHRRHRHRPRRAGHFLRPVRRAGDRVRPAVPPRRHDPLRHHHRHGRADRPQDHPPALAFAASR